MIFGIFVLLASVVTKRIGCHRKLGMGYFDKRQLEEWS